jgi:hypothetical protein
MSRMTSHRAIVTLVGAALLFAAGAPEALVICVGEDGHAAIEVLATGACEPCPGRMASEPPQAGHAADAGGDHCGPCVDMALLRYVVGKKLTSAKDQIEQAQAALQVLPPSADDLRGFTEPPLRVSFTPPPGRGSSQGVVRLI